MRQRIKNDGKISFNYVLDLSGKEPAEQIKQEKNYIYQITVL